MNWIYKGSVCSSSLEGCYGFIYKITYVGPSTPLYPTGSIYIGKKAFTHTNRKKLSKKAKLLPENKGKRIMKVKKDSGWKDYYGSSKELLAFIKEVGKEHFTREIICFTKSKAWNSYLELRYQLKYKVLEIPSFNRWVGGKVFKSQLNQENHECECNTP